MVVGSAPYAGPYQQRVEAAAAGDPRVRLLGAVWDQDLLDALYSGALTYLHGHSVGGTNPSLLRAMGAAAATTAFDVVFTREVLGGTGVYFASPQDVAARVEEAEADPGAARARGRASQERASEHYVWDEVTDRYEELCQDLAARRRRARRSLSRRRARGGPPTGAVLRVSSRRCGSGNSRCDPAGALPSPVRVLTLGEGRTAVPSTSSERTP